MGAVEKNVLLILYIIIKALRERPFIGGFSQDVRLLASVWSIMRFKAISYVKSIAQVTSREGFVSPGH